MSKTFNTPMGTELPLSNIKGKDYLQAAPRIVWMREEHPDWAIETSFLQLTEKVAICQATIRDGSGKILAQGTSLETPIGFESYVEKAETCAIARAVGFCGYGTLMAQDLEEQGKLAEAPLDPREGPKSQSGDPGAYVIKCGKKYPGQRLDKIGHHDALQYANWMKSEAASKRKPLTGDWLEAVNAIEAFAKSREFSR